MHMSCCILGDRWRFRLGTAMRSTLAWKSSGLSFVIRSQDSFHCATPDRETYCCFSVVLAFRKRHCRAIRPQSLFKVYHIHHKQALLDREKSRMAARKNVNLENQRVEVSHVWGNTAFHFKLAGLLVSPQSHCDKNSSFGADMNQKRIVRRVGYHVSNASPHGGCKSSKLRPRYA